MRLGVIVCPECKKAKGVDLSCKTTKCIRCGKIIKLEKIRILYETESRQKLQNVIGLINADVEGKLDDFKKTIQKQ